MDNKHTVLFVDDEPNILRSIRRELFDAPFTVLTAGSAAEGLILLKDNAIDLVISDVKMPEMDGIQFLELVKKQFPKVNRVILSGYVEQTTVVASIVRGVASTYFAKPWKADELRQNIEQILRIKTLLNDQALMTLLNSIHKLPSLPSVYQDFLAAVEQDSPTKALAQILNQDVSLTIRILQVANSVFYSTQKISSVERALIQLGTNIVKDIALTLSFSSQMSWTIGQSRHLEEIFKHSSRVSHLTAELYKMVHHKHLDESSSSIALTHDIGKIILLQYFPDTFQQVHKLMEADEALSFQQAEQQISPSGTTHCEIGAYFLSWWNLPSINISAALYHHNPMALSGKEADLIHIVSLANQLTNFLPYISENKWLAQSENSPFTPQQRSAFWTLAQESHP